MTRAATSDDAKFIAQVYKHAKKELGSFNLYQCWDFYLSGKNNEKFIVIPEIGFVRWGYSVRNRVNVLKDIAIMPDQKGKGFGRILMNAVPKPFFLKCNLDNVDGNKFYIKNGLKLTGQSKTKKGVIQNVYLCVE